MMKRYQISERKDSEDENRICQRLKTKEFEVYIMNKEINSSYMKRLFIYKYGTRFEKF